MDDSEIITLLFARDETGLSALADAHKRICLASAAEITGNTADAEECWLDTCMAVWNSIPPQKPDSLRGYLLRICRNLALNRVKAQQAQKRCAVLVELEECVAVSMPDAGPEEIGLAVDAFLETLPKKEAVLFVKRYFYSESVKGIAAQFGTSENYISKVLAKLRKKLKKYLTERGISI